MCDHIILILVYLTHLPTFQILGLLFGLSESTTNYIYISTLAGDIQRFTVGFPGIISKKT
ncbi:MULTISPECIES: transposase family protein [Planktothricoides]|uniref:Transposase family protein n=1 Tax=Planktothricoides raciborskii GIHE-MW2 TaxID=2792601 RepID=A0AAU8JMM7_9CYAN|nr:transposase family protein [Planktothricoides sp. SR001]